MIEGLPAETRDALARFHFDRIPFETLRARVAANAADLDALHRITEPVSAPDPSEVAVAPDPSSDEGRALRDEGAAAIARGELAVVILAGGMATRFGARVKALAPLADGSAVRFLDAKLADVARAGGGRVDTTVMTSFATDDALARALEGTPAHRAPQFVSLRLTPTGELFRGDDGAPSLYAPGHGDLPDALAHSGTLDRLRAAGVRTVLMMNVDNVGATVDPAVFAQHRRLGGAITVELVSKRAGDKGGLPVRRGDQLVLAEAFRLPADFPHDRFPLFNTNTLWIDVDALHGDFPWTWCVARKKVDGRDAVQMERLVGELTWWRPTRYLHVPREGARSRFIPVKDVEELRRSRGEIEQVLRERVGLAL